MHFLILARAREGKPKLRFQHLAATTDDDTTGCGGIDGTAPEVVGLVVRQPGSGGGSNRSGHDGLQVDVVEVGHPARGVRQPDGVPALLELYGQRPCGHLAPAA